VRRASRYDVARVSSPGSPMALAISRALGDFCLKACGAAGAPLVLAEPEVTHEGLSLASGSGSGRQLLSGGRCRSCCRRPHARHGRGGATAATAAGGRERGARHDQGL
jgi:hypothetical protein